MQVFAMILGIIIGAIILVSIIAWFIILARWDKVFDKLEEGYFSFHGYPNVSKKEDSNVDDIEVTLDDQEDN